jgi:hypothetical protein
MKNRGSPPPINAPADLRSCLARERALQLGCPRRLEWTSSERAAPDSCSSMKPSVARSRHDQPLTAPSATSASPSVAGPEAMPTSVMITLRPISGATPASTAESGTRPLPNVTTKPLRRRAGGRMLPDGPATAALRPLRGLRAGRTPVSRGSRPSSLEARTVMSRLDTPVAESAPRPAIQCRDSEPLSRLRKSSLECLAG